MDTAAHRAGKALPVMPRDHGANGDGINKSVLIRFCLGDCAHVHPEQMAQVRVMQIRAQRQIGRVRAGLVHPGRPRSICIRQGRTVRMQAMRDGAGTPNAICSGAASSIGER